MFSPCLLPFHDTRELLFGSFLLSTPNAALPAATQESCWSFSPDRAREILTAAVRGTRPLRSLLISHTSFPTPRLHTTPASALLAAPPPAAGAGGLRLLCLICSDLGEPRAFIRSLAAAGELRVLLLGGSVFSSAVATQPAAAVAAADPVAQEGDAAESDGDGEDIGAPPPPAAAAAAPPATPEEARRQATAAVAEALNEAGALLPSLVVLEVSCCCPSDPTARAAAWLPWPEAAPSPEDDPLSSPSSCCSCFGPPLVGQPGRPAIWDLFEENTAAALAAAGAARLAAAAGLGEGGAGEADLRAALGAAASAVRAQDGRRMSMLHHAALAGSAAHAAALLSLGARPDYRNAAGSTALFLAAEQGSEPVVEALLKAGAKIPVANNAGEGPLYISALTGREGAIGALLRHCVASGWHLREMGGPDGWSPLHAAAVAGRERIMGIILAAAAQAGAEEDTQELLDSTNRYGALLGLQCSLPHCAQVE